MDRKKANDSVLVLACLGVLGYGGTVAFPVQARATLECCGLQAGTCGEPDQWCKQGQCDAGPIVAHGYCVTHAMED
jgi:hypothetical protein